MLANSVHINRLVKSRGERDPFASTYHTIPNCCCSIFQGGDDAGIRVKPTNTRPKRRRPVSLTMPRRLLDGSLFSKASIFPPRMSTEEQIFRHVAAQQRRVLPVLDRRARFLREVR